MQARALVGSPASALERRIRLVLMAYAAGDAFGVGYEFLDEPIPVDPLTLRPRLGDDTWPFGGVSDDTHLSLLTIDAVVASDPAGSGEGFLARLLAAAPTLRGLGPTTRAALGLPVPEDQVGLIGTTNGAMMRTALIGMAFAPEARRDRRRMVAALARATHSDPAAVATSVLCSALFATALDEVPSSVPDALWTEASELAELPASVLELLRDDEWSPPSGGISLNPVDTLAAVVWVVARSHGVSDAFRLACELGGDTDTVAALSGSLVIARSENPNELLELPWIDDVLWDEIVDLSASGTRLSELRVAA